MHSNSALLKSLLQSSKPGSTSVLTLPQLSLLLFLVASFSTLSAAGRAGNADIEQTVVFVVHIFDLDLRFHVDSVEQPIKRNSVGSGHVSHCWTSAFGFLLGLRFLFFKKCKARRQNEKISRLRRHNRH